MPLNFPTVLGTQYLGANSYQDINKLPIYDMLMEQRASHQKRWDMASADMSMTKNNYGGSTAESPPKVGQKAQFSFQMTNTTIDAISGYYTDNKRCYQLDSVSSKRDKAIYQQNLVQKKIVKDCYLLDEIAGAFDHCIRTGVAFIEIIGLDVNDIEFLPSIKVWDAWSTMFDINGRKADGSDWEYFTATSYITKTNAKYKYPDIDAAVLNRGIVAGESTFNFCYRTNATDSISSSMVQEFNVWLREITDYSFWLDINTNRVIPLEREDLLTADGEWRKQTKRVLGWRKNQYINGVLCRSYLSPFGDTVPFVPFFWSFNPEVAIEDQRYSSLVRQTRDSTHALDWFLNMNFDAMAARPNGGVIYRKGSLDNHAANNKENIANWEYAGDIKPDFFPMSVFPQDNVLAAQYISSIARQAAPVDFAAPEVTRNDSGEKVALMQSSQVRGLAPYMARLNRSLCYLGRLMCKNTCMYMSEELAAQILQEEVDPFFWSVGQNAAEFSAITGLFTETQKQQTYLLAMQMFRDWGRPPSTAVMKEIAVIPNREKIFSILEEEDRVLAEQSQITRAIEEEQRKAVVEKDKSQALLNLFRTKEAEANAASTIGLAQEHSSRAGQDVALAVKNYAEALKTIAEIEAMYNKEEIENLLRATKSISEEIQEEKETPETKQLGVLHESQAENGGVGTHRGAIVNALLSAQGEG